MVCRQRRWRYTAVRLYQLLKQNKKRKNIRQLRTKKLTRKTKTKINELDKSRNRLERTALFCCWESPLFIKCEFSIYNSLLENWERMSNLVGLFKKWAWRYIKYNVIGLSVFLLNIVLYVVLFNFLGEWSYIIVSANGGIIEFILIAYFNKTKRGVIFDSCTPNESK